jgi:hypothetical protein
MNKYKVAYITGDSNNISFTLESTIQNINSRQGEIKEIVQSQSTHPGGTTIVTITIIYTIMF